MKNLVITGKGQELISKMIAGATMANFTKIATSDYDYSNATLEKLTELKNIKQMVPVSKVSRTDAMTVEVLAAIDNSKLTESYYVRVLGLYAEDGDGNEILYGVSIETANPDYMPAFEGKTASGISFKLNTKVGNSEQITLEVSPSATPTLEQVGELVKAIDNIQENYVKGAGIELSMTDGILTVTYDDGISEGSEE